MFIPYWCNFEHATVSSVACSLCVPGTAHVLKGEPMILVYGSQGKFQTQPDGGGSKTRSQSTVGNAWRSKFLGFSFYKRDGQPKIRIHQKAINRFKERVRELTHRSSGKSLSQVIYNLNLYLKGWWNYYGLTQGRTIFRSLNGWILRRLRCLLVRKCP